jgi:hypothetical protein
MARKPHVQKKGVQGAEEMPRRIEVERVGGGGRRRMSNLAYKQKKNKRKPKGGKMERERGETHEAERKLS